jgi:hypothetical protein
VTSPSAALLQVVATEAERPLPFAVTEFVTAATRRFGVAVSAVLFYGSCRRADQPDGLYDLYVILDHYRDLPRLEGVLAALLPPNVYYLEVATESGTRRAKCTVISRADFARGVQRWFHSYLWGRFCQPVSIAYARDSGARDEILGSLGSAVLKFIHETLCLQRDTFDTRALWVDGLRTSYQTELRSEGPDRAAELFSAHADYYRGVTGAAGLSAAGQDRWRASLTPSQRSSGLRRWRVRGVTGKLQALARILKAWITFDGGFDYIIWKLERHSGRHIEVPERVRRHPGLHMWGFFWRLYRDGVFR